MEDLNESVATEAGTVTGAEESAGALEQFTETQTDSQETQGSGTKESGETSPNSPPANERIQQLLSSTKEQSDRIARLEQQLTHETRQQQQPQFVQLDMAKVNTHFQETLDRIDELRLEGRAAEALDLQDGLNALRQEIRQNEAKRQQHLQRQQATEQSAQQIQQLNTQIQAAAELVRNDANITSEVWQAGEKFFAAERQANKLLDAQYREMCMLQGPIAGMLFAKDYVMKNMGTAQKQATETKNSAKSQVPGGKTSSTIPTTKDYKTMSDEDFHEELNRVKFGT